ncbi:peptidoglycan bridge formation glycyltransferase FemA/FemB family protein [Winogradskyella helgolandensis]|uniref:peptidoglycan bridge formation glycyltransferase FemA/FemB family protein n=1 Tax=Winogradskyella helgolandensis TaxID=2697010 RepID=UPI0015BF26BA|nr:peptidoglycan bridge formation glycyltransferase FemA/FemB family protein [Winogradskyella helgolandensis]
MIEVIKDKNEWRTLLSKVEHTDFYHTYDYHQLSKKEGELPILLKYTDGSTIIALPFLIRNIDNSDYKDITSVYGYSGLLSINIDDNFKIKNFHKSLNAFFNKNKIIAVFSRLHPFIEARETALEGLGKIVSLGKVVYIDLSKTLVDQRATYNRRLKTYLNKARKLCTVIEGHTDEHIQTFIQLYIKNMKRIGADESYLFNSEYFYKLLSSKDYESKLMLCKHNETQEIIAGAIFTKKGNIVQYHLSGINEDYFSLQPVKLIIDEMSIYSTKKGYQYLNLGGGKGSKEDSLYRFKSKFSKNYKVFKIWKYIVDRNAYKTLTENHLNTELEDHELDIGYFPAYRAPIKSISYMASLSELLIFSFN